MCFSFNETANFRYKHYLGHDHTGWREVIELWPVHFDASFPFLAQIMIHLLVVLSPFKILNTLKASYIHR